MKIQSNKEKSIFKAQRASFNSLSEAVTRRYSILSKKTLQQRYFPVNFEKLLRTILYRTAQYNCISPDLNNTDSTEQGKELKALNFSDGRSKRTHKIAGFLNYYGCYIICNCSTANKDVVAHYLWERLNYNLYYTLEKLIFQFVYIFFCPPFSLSVRRKMR